jgi:drug/metabolite transporter (DMT)-like permease
MNLNNSSRLGATDILMLFTCLFWAVNFSVVKIALREFAPHAFNGPRLAVASILLLVFLWRKEGSLAVGRADLLKIVVLGILGNTFYQLLFINGISRTTASSTSLVMTMTPIFIALLSAGFSGERIHGTGWAGIFLAFSGLYLVIFGHFDSISLSGQSLNGDLFILVGNLCWAAFTVFSKPLLERMSPLKLSALTLAAGSLFYLPVAARDIFTTPWTSLSPRSWAALAYSMIFAIAVGYVIWYSSVQRVGNTKTGIYGYITPVFTVFFAHIFLAEGVHPHQIAGVLIIFVGFYLTRFGDRLLLKRRAGA